MFQSFLDQNALLALGRKARAPEFRNNLDMVLNSGSVAVVVSTWHLIEIAHTTNVANAVELAEFMDSLNPGWLLERHDLQKLEVEDDFCRFVGLTIPNRPRITTRSAAIAAMRGQKDSPRFDIPSRKFVQQWIQHPEQMKPVEDSLAFNTESLTRLRQLARDGKITEEIRRRVNEILVKDALPQRTPAGIILGPELNAAYLKQVQIQAIPTLAIETAISEQEWIVKDGSGADRNTVIDKFHLISALPYVDEIVTNDAFFRKVYPSAEKTGHVKAQLVSNEDFLKRF